MLKHRTKNITQAIVRQKSNFKHSGKNLNVNWGDIYFFQGLVR